MALLDDAPVTVRPEISAALEREWGRLAAPGSFWSGRERVAIAAEARRARSSLPPADADLAPLAIEFARALGATPASTSRVAVEGAIGRLGPGAYVELVGVVSRGAAVDAFHRSIGAALPEFPQPVVGSPSGEQESAASPGPAWVPMVGGSSIVAALSLVPAEAAAQEDLHGPLYLTYAEMGDLEFRRGLDRAQMELVAARTSAINECFY